MIDRKFCSNCGTLVYPGTKFCQKCGGSLTGAPHPNNSQIPPQPWKPLGVHVEEFKSMKDFKKWREDMGTRVKILKVIPYTLPWLIECYTITYERFS